PMFGKGTQLDKDYFEIMEGVKMFFYNSESIQRDFNKYGLVQVSEIDEPNKHMENKPSINFLMIKCQKEL
ncbi:SAM-dependent methyltransferase, partial [Bacillus cereus]